MNDPKGLFKMKFVGKPNGKFMKGAPGNYIHGEEYNQPWGNGDYPYWQRMEEAPVLVAPEPSEADNVFDEEEEIYVPDETPVVILQPKVEIMIEEIPEAVEAEPVEVSEISVEPLETVVHEETINIDPNTRATMEPHMSFNTGTGALSEYDEPIPVEETVSSIETTEPPVETLDRKALLNALELAEVEVKKGTKTTTLKKMVDKLEP